MKHRFYLNAFLILLFLVLTAGCSNSKKDYEKAEKLNTIEAYEKFLQKHATSEFTDRARRKIEELEWQGVEKLNTTVAYKEFLKKYPSGYFAEIARQKIELPKQIIQKIKECLTCDEGVTCKIVVRDNKYYYLVDIKDNTFSLNKIEVNKGQKINEINETTRKYGAEFCSDVLVYAGKFTVGMAHWDLDKQYKE